MKQQAERAAVEFPAYVGLVVDEFDVQIVVGPESESLGNVVDFCRQDPERFIETETFGDLQKRCSFLEFAASACVGAENPDHW